MKRTLLGRALVAGVALVASHALVPTPAAAGPPPADKGQVYNLGQYCSSQDGIIEIGGRLKVKEFGRSGVTQFRVKWLLYNTDLGSPGIHVAYKRRTEESRTFPNNRANYHFDSGKTWKDLVATDDGYTLVAKVTWVRSGRRDWNQKYTWAYCQ